MKAKKILLIVLAIIICAAFYSCADNNNDTEITKITEIPEISEPETNNNDEEEKIMHDFTNPIAPTGNDPWLIFHEGYYYYCVSEKGGVCVARIENIYDLNKAELIRVWLPPSGTNYSKEIWAPELHYLNGEWYIYFAADDGKNENHRMYVLKGTTQNPLDGFDFVGQITDDSNKWAIDGTVMQYNNKLYFIWSGWMLNTNVSQLLYIAEMSDPCTISGKRVKISSPEKSWELIGNPTINEGPVAIEHNGTTHIVYSASGSWTDDYCLGLLTLTRNDPLLPDSWTKSDKPILSKNSKVFGPGHCSFTTSPDGSETWVIYHANKISGTGWGGRNAWAQPVTWDENNYPVIGDGNPLAPGEILSIPVNPIESIDSADPVPDVSYTDATMEDSGIYWEDEIITVYKPSNGGVWYPRICALSDGTLLCAFDTNENHANTIIKIMKSVDGGLNWEEHSVIDYYPGLDCANPALIELENGDIWLSHRANITRPSGRYYSTIQNNISHDGGKTWENHSVIEEQLSTGGVYEPHFGRIGGKIAVFYANDSRSAVTAHTEQNIEFKTWENDKNEWSEKYIASDGTKTHSRDGMPVWDIRSDGRYILAVEATNVNGFPFVLQIKTSPDGYDWSEELKNVYIPHTKGRKAAAPYVAALPDGRLILSFQTDEDSKQAGDNYSVMKVMVSADKTGEVWNKPFMPFDIPDSYCAVWNGLYVHNGYIYAVTSANYPGSGIYLRRAGIQDF